MNLMIAIILENKSVVDLFVDLVFDLVQFGVDVFVELRVECLCRGRYVEVGLCW